MANEAILAVDELDLTEHPLAGTGVVVPDTQVPLREHFDQSEQVEDRAERNEQRRTIVILSDH